MADACISEFYDKVSFSVLKRPGIIGRWWYVENLHRRFKT